MSIHRKRTRCAVAVLAIALPVLTDAWAGQSSQFVIRCDFTDAWDSTAASQELEGVPDSPRRFCWAIRDRQRLDAIFLSLVAPKGATLRKQDQLVY